MRKGVIDRKTAETTIRVTLNLDGRGRFENRTGIRFLDHMLDLVARHGGFDLTVKASGDLDVDQHHTVEDVGIALGEAVAQALGDRARHQSCWLLRHADGRDAGGRGDRSRRAPAYGRGDEGARCGSSAICRPSSCTISSTASRAGARANVHVKVMYGRSNHHKIEACFKAFARALRVACAKDRAAGEDAAEHEGAAVIALVDYGAGNLTSVRKALVGARCGVRDAAAPDDLARRAAASSCRASAISAPPRAITDDWRRAIRAAVDRGAALLGHLPRDAVAVRGQRRSARAAGIGCFAGTCELLTAGGTQNLRLPVVAGGAETGTDPTPLRISDGVKGRFKIPHVGWNSLELPRASAVMAGVAPDAQVYFTHSYVAPVTRRHRRGHDLRRAVHRRRRARPHRRRAVPPGEVGRRRAADPSQLGWTSL